MFTVSCYGTGRLIDLFQPVFFSSHHDVQARERMRMQNEDLASRMWSLERSLGGHMNKILATEVNQVRFVVLSFSQECLFVCLNTETDVCWRCCWLCIRPRNAKRRARRRLRRCGGSGRSSSSTPVKCGTSTKVRVAIVLLSLLTRLMEVVVLFVVVQHCFFLYSPALFAPTYTVDATCGTGG